MLVALSIKNFKSIREARVRFGELTCLIGHNGVGKSNLFDAIHFLSALAERDISEAAAEVKSTSDGSYSPLDLVFGRDPHRKIELSADMVVPRQVEDDFGQTAESSTALLTYALTLQYVAESDRFVVERESLTHAKLGDYRKFTGFASSASSKNRCLRARELAEVGHSSPLIQTSRESYFTATAVAGDAPHRSAGHR